MVTFKKLKVFITAIIFLLALGVLGGFSGSALAATVGDQLFQPEEGWKRYDDTHPAFSYNGVWRASQNTETMFYQRTSHLSETNGDTIKFDFTGTKLRIINRKAPNRSKDIKIIIDGKEEYFSSYNGSYTTGFDINYEKKDLERKRHSVVIENGSGYFIFDAIDIDADGYLVSPDIETLELVGDVANDVNSLTWNEIENATYNVKRATTAGGPYTTIANELTTNSYIDSDVEGGVTYYYVVTAVLRGSESENSNEVVLTREGEEPAPQPEPDGNAKLTLHLVDNQIKEYEVTLDEVDRFSNWFDKRMSGTGQAYYVFELKHNITPYKTIKEYMVFDKIVWYEVKEY